LESREGTEKFDFKGIVALSNCSGSIVRFDDSRSTDKAMVLSNGHCVGMIKPGTAIVDKPSRLSFTVLNENAGKLGRVNAEKIIYATLTKTDASLFLLKETFQDIESLYGIKPLTFARKAPAVGMSIEIISGYWKRGYSCQIETYVKNLQEAGWSWTDSLRYSRPGCETIGGTSGSPVIEAGTRTVVAVNNTGNESGELCTMNNPCEVGEDGKKTATKGYSYAQQTHWFYACRNGVGEFDVNQPECVLQK
jgi:V8-like Glu-specific endopeptidase